MSEHLMKVSAPLAQQLVVLYTKVHIITLRGKTKGFDIPLDNHH